MYDREEIQLPPNLTPPEGVPEIALTQDRIEGNYSEQELLELHHGHLAAITYLDAQIGRVLDELDALGLRDNTVVVFWSDHGVHIGEHGLMRKTTLFELDAGVPMIIATPEHPGGQVANGLVELLDLYPTLAELSGIQPPAGLAGVSLVPMLQDPSAKVKDTALTQTIRPNYPRGADPEVMGYSIRSENFRFMEWRDFKTGEIQARELYDHRSDPAETKNLAEDPSFTDEIQSHAEQLVKILKSIPK
jgi:iduronate 2-sulfatase